MKQSVLVVILFSAFITAHASDWQPAHFNPNVVDETKTLSVDETEQINSKIEQLYHDKDVRAAVYVLNRLDHETIESAAEKTFRKWHLGSKGKDNGLLFIFSLQDHHARLEVGYGLEGDIPDIAARHLLDDSILPYFKKQEYAAGILNGLSQLDGGMPQTVPSDETSDETTETARPKISPATLNETADHKSGLIAWLIWISILFIPQLLMRLRQPTPHSFLFLMGLDSIQGKFLKGFFIINPGIFIYIAGTQAHLLYASLLTESFQQLLQPWKIWAAAVFVLPALLKTVYYACGTFKRRHVRALAKDQKVRPFVENPVWSMGPISTLFYLFDLSDWRVWILKVVLLIIPGAHFIVFPELATPGILVSFIAGYFALANLFMWKSVLEPLLSDKAYARLLAARRLSRIQRRVQGTREIFGKSYTYSPSSSSESSSFSSSSDGGSSGGGGASSSW